MGQRARAAAEREAGKTHLDDLALADRELQWLSQRAPRGRRGLSALRAHFNSRARELGTRPESKPTCASASGCVHVRASERASERASASVRAFTYLPAVVRRVHWQSGHEAQRVVATDDVTLLRRGTLADDLVAVRDARRSLNELALRHRR